jgi:hypothetical protein
VVTVTVVVALVIVLVSLLSPRADVTSQESESAAAGSSQGSIDAPTGEARLSPTDVVASSEFTGLHASHLIDGDTSSTWNDDSLRGDGAELAFRFRTSVALTAVEFQNLTEEERFRRNYRIRGYEIHLTPDDRVAPVTGSLEDLNRPQRVDLPYTETRAVTVHVTSAYPAEPYGGDPPFDELALAEVTFFGVEK